ncbi:MAG: cyclic nucleotide-binding domain-containing protein [Synechococcus sp.]
MLFTSPLPTPVELFADQQDGDLLTYPTGATVFRAGDPVDAVYALQRGMVELSAQGEAGKLRYGAGEIFSYEDLSGTRLTHSHDARALTPVEVVRLPRTRFVELILRHPTIVLALLERQHSRLREQRLQARHYY